MYATASLQDLNVCRQQFKVNCINSFSKNDALHALDYLLSWVEEDDNFTDWLCARTLLRLVSGGVLADGDPVPESGPALSRHQPRPWRWTTGKH